MYIFINRKWKVSLNRLIRSVLLACDCLYLKMKYKHNIPKIVPRTKKTVEQMTAVRVTAPPYDS